MVPAFCPNQSRGRSPLCFLCFALFFRAASTDYMAMEDFDLRTLGRNILMLLAILSVLVIAEMVLVSAEEPGASVQQQAAYGKNSVI